MQRLNFFVNVVQCFVDDVRQCEKQVALARSVFFGFREFCFMFLSGCADGFLSAHSYLTVRVVSVALHRGFLSEFLMGGGGQ